MMRRIPRFFLALSICLIMLSCVNKKDLKLDLTKLPEQTHLGDGFWVKPLPDFNQARSYLGFQAPGYSASISIKKDYNDLEYYIARYNGREGAFGAKKLLDKRNVIVEGEKKGIMVRFMDPKNIYRIRMVLEVEDKLYKISAFYRAGYEDKYEDQIMDAFESLSFGGYEKPTERPDGELQLAKVLVDPYRMIYTRDNKFPTESFDELVLEESVIKNIKAQSTDDIFNKAFKNVFGKVIDLGRSTNVESFSSGRIYKKKAETEQKKLWYILSVRLIILKRPL